MGFYPGNCYSSCPCISKIFHVFAGMGVSVLPSGWESMVAKRK